MSCSVMLIPVIVTSWPTILPVLTAAAGALGYSLSRKQQGAATAGPRSTTVTVTVKDCVLEGESSKDQAMVMEKDGVSVRFSIEPTGQVKVCVSGTGRTKAELDAIGRQVAGRVVQTYAYHRVMAEAKNLGFNAVEEQVDAQGAIRIRLRRE